MTIISRMPETSHLPSRHPGTRTSASAISIRMWLALMSNGLLDAIAPKGYEDESGFHYGEPPRQTDSFD